MSDIQVRKAGLQDVETLRSIKLESSTILLTRLGHTLEQIGDWHRTFATPEYFQKMVRSPHSLYLVEEDGVAKGMAGLTMGDNGLGARSLLNPARKTKLGPASDYVYFSNLYTLSLARGLGSRLMSHRLGVIENFNISAIVCHVHVDNDRARRFVEHYGMRVLEEYQESRLGNKQIVYWRPSQT